MNDEEEQGREEAVLAKQRQGELEDLRWLLGNAQGRRIALRMLDRTGVYRSSFNHSGSVMAFSEGRRDIGLWLTAELLEASPDRYLKLLRESAGK